MTELINEFNLKGSKSTKSSITAHCTVRNVESKNTELCEGALPSCSKSSINMWNLFFLLGQCLIQSCHTVQWGKQPDQQATVTAVSSLISHTLFPVTLSSSSLSADTVNTRSYQLVDDHSTEKVLTFYEKIVIADCTGQLETYCSSLYLKEGWANKKPDHIKKHAATARHNYKINKAC